MAGMEDEETREKAREIAEEHDVDHVIIYATATRCWVYDREGNVVQSDVSPLDTPMRGKVSRCFPQRGSDGFYACTVEHDNVVISEFGEQI